MQAASSLNQGLNFQRITASYHGGKRKNRSKNKMTKKHGGSKRSTRRKGMRGGGMFTPYADYPTALDQILPNDIRELARIAPLDAKFAELPGIERAAGVPMSGGRRKTRRGLRGGKSPINAPSMLLSTSTEEAAARLNPQWYTENTIIPNFRGPLPVPGQTPSVPAKGGKRNRRNKRKLTMRS